MLEIRERHGPQDFTTHLVYEDGEFKAVEAEEGEEPWQSSRPVRWTD